MSPWVPSRRVTVSSTKLLGVLAIVAAACFAAIVALQAVEMLHYGADPSVWPPTP